MDGWLNKRMNETTESCLRPLAFTCLLHMVIISNLEKLSRNFPLDSEKSHINSVDWV